MGGRVDLVGLGIGLSIGISVEGIVEVRCLDGGRLNLGLGVVGIGGLELEVEEALGTCEKDLS